MGRKYGGCDGVHRLNEFVYERLDSVDKVRKAIKFCEGKHVQQCAYSTFMDTLTQICFTERVIRSTIEWSGNKSWVPSGETFGA
jgi:hypothetical protein